MDIVYKNMVGELISLVNLLQGVDFIVEVIFMYFVNQNYWIYEELALEQIFFLGWEIRNICMFGFFDEVDMLEYQDIWDDWVYSFFDLGWKKIKIFWVQLNVAYQGCFYLLVIWCVAMYKVDIEVWIVG